MGGQVERPYRQEGQKLGVFMLPYWHPDHHTSQLITCLPFQCPMPTFMTTLTYIDDHGH